MSLQYAKVGITARSDIEGKEELVKRIATIVSKSGAEVLLDEKRCKIPSLDSYKTYSSVKGLDLLLVIGGDGTILRALREMDDHSVPILSVNRGTVGFLAEIALDEADTLIPKLLSGQGQIEERGLLLIEARRDKKEIWKGHVLNEAVISQGAISRLINLPTTVQGEKLTTFHADGVIIASPTGSTAYSLSAGGPIVHPRLPSVILTPISPHSLSQKPIVLPTDMTIDIEVFIKENKFGDIQVSLTMDGQTYVTLQGGDHVIVTTDGATVKFLRRKEDTFFETLRTKLKWGEATLED